MEEQKIELSFPIKQELSEKFLRKNFWKCLFTSVDNELQYWVILPNNVKPVELNMIKLDNIGITNIGRYARIDDSPYLEVLVAYEHCPYEMNASDWILKKLYIMQESTIKQRIINGKSTGTYLDALTHKKLLNGEDVVSRYTVLKDYDKKKGGANYFCIKASCSIKDYEGLANTILQIVTNWDLINKTDWQMAESLKPFIIPFTGKVEFYIPDSWNVTYDTENTDKRSRFVFSHTINNNNEGVINAYFYELGLFDDYKAVFDESIKRLINLEGFESELRQFETFKANQIRNPSIEEISTTNGFFSYKKENFTSYVQFFIIRTKQGWYYFESVGPKPNLENYFWEVNKRCLELIKNTFNNLEFKKRENK